MSATLIVVGQMHLCSCISRGTIHEYKCKSIKIHKIIDVTVCYCIPVTYNWIADSIPS